MKCVQQPSSRGKSKNPEGRNNCIEGTNSLFCKQHLLGHLKIGFNFVCVFNSLQAEGSPKIQRVEIIVLKVQIVYFVSNIF